MPFMLPAPQHPSSSFVVVTPSETGTGLTLGGGEKSWLQWNKGANKEM